MKWLFILTLLLFSFVQLQAQQGDFEVKVVSKKYKTIKGVLQKVSPEGIGVEDDKGNYFTFRPEEITRIKVRKRGLTIGEGFLSGTIIGAGAGVSVMSLSEGETDRSLVALGVILTGTGMVTGTVSGVVSELLNTRLMVVVNQDDAKYKAQYKKLEKYLNGVVTEHVGR